MVTNNTFSPLLTTSNPSGQSHAPNIAANTAAAAQNFSALMRNRAYARLDASTMALANPDFASGAAGRIIGSLTEGNQGRSPQISRGYIRRTVLDNGDPTSRYRLYFMYNPDTIQRDYVSYLDQEALDPFNTVFGSNNLVAPPGVLDFSFNLFFDRQTENANGTMPRGVLEDYDFFDLVVRGVVPDVQSSAVPDNGVMMINPRNITVVFSPQLSVQGRPNSASVVYEKFDHRMRPIRMTIQIDMKAFYIGAVRQDFTFAQAKEVGTVSATIPYDESIKYKLSSTTLKAAKIQARAKLASSTSPLGSTPGTPSGGTATGNTGAYPITSPFGPRGNGFHAGIDFGCPAGTKVIAPVPLVINHAGPAGSTLNLEGFGTSVAGTDFGGLFLIFGHLGSVTVNPGQVVQTGQVLGLSNNTGASEGNHLHFEIRQGGGEGGSSIDPAPFLAKGWQVLA